MCVCVWMNRRAHERSTFPSVALKPSVSQTYPCLHTHTLPRGDIRGLTGVKSSVVHLVFLCCVQPWAVLPHSGEAQSAAPIQWPQPSSGNQTTLNTSSLSVIPLPSFQVKLFHPPPHPFIDVKHLTTLAAAACPQSSMCLICRCRDVDVASYKQRK